MLVLSRKKVARLCGMTQPAISMAVRRGRLSQVDILIDGTVHRGVTFKSVREYHNWSQALCDQILDPHGLTEETDTFWTDGLEDTGVEEPMDVLTPTAAAQLFGSPIPAVLEASREGKVATPLALGFTAKVVRLIDLKSATAFWGRERGPGYGDFDSEIERMRAYGVRVSIDSDDYRVLHAYPLVVRGDAINLAKDME